jgi:hypothetical protein
MEMVELEELLIRPCRAALRLEVVVRGEVTKFGCIDIGDWKPYCTCRV